MDRKNVITKQIPIKMKSSSCLVHSVKITVHIVTYYITDAKEKCKAQTLLYVGLEITCPPHLLWSQRHVSKACQRTRRHISRLHNDPCSFSLVTIWGQLWQMILVTPRWKKNRLTDSCWQGGFTGFFMPITVAWLPAVTNFVDGPRWGKKKNSKNCFCWALQHVCITLWCISAMLS